MPQVAFALARQRDVDGEAQRLVAGVARTFDELADESTGITVDAAVLATGPDAASYLAGLEPGWQQNLANLDRLLAGE